MKQLTKEQHEAILNWLKEWDQIKDTAIPIRFKESFPPSAERKYKHVVTFDMNKTAEKNNKEIAEMLSGGNIVLTDQEGKPYYINKDDLKITISEEDLQTSLKKVNDIIEANRI